MRVLLILMIVSFSALAQTDKLVDPRDGKEYKVVQIGSQVWMAENLKYADTIVHLYKPQWYNSKNRISFQTPKDYETIPNYYAAGIYCYDDSGFFCKKYGMLYTWQAAKSACPVGWHLPSEQEFKALLFTAGGDDKEKIKLALLSGGSSGFEALPGGCLDLGVNGNDKFFYYRDKDENTYFWSSTVKHEIIAMDIEIKKHVSISKQYTSEAFSVRCIKD